MKKLVLTAIALVLIAVPLFAATETGSDQVQISLTITADTVVTIALNDTATLRAGLTGSTNFTNAGHILLTSSVGATWYFVIESLQTSSGNTGRMVSENGDTFDYWIFLAGGVSVVSLTTGPKVFTMTAPENTTITYPVWIQYGATNALPVGTYTDTIKITCYDSDPT